MNKYILGLLISFIILASCETPNEDNSIEIEWIAKFEGIINGEGVDEALGYNYGSNEKPHKLVLIDTDGKPYENFNEKLPQNWFPNSIEETQLVAVCNQRWEYIQTCNYGAAGTIKVKRRRDCIVINLFDAKTGEAAKNSIYEVWGISGGPCGTMPPSCPSTSSLGGGYLDGDKVVYDDIISWLRLYVDPE